MVVAVTQGILQRFLATAPRALSLVAIPAEMVNPAPLVPEASAE
jgi:hypothetical protein